MKINIFLSFIGIALALLIGYLAYYLADDQENNIICGIGSTICFIATLIPSIGINYESSRLGTNVRVFSALFFILFLVSHFTFAGFGVIMPYYLICNAILLIIYLAIFYKIIGIKNM